MSDLDRQLLRAKDAIDRAYGEPLDVQTLARLANTSPAYFIRRFKGAFGETPHQYLMTRRIERAKALLRVSKLSVTDVCQAVGFASLGSFSARFTELVGESPRRYRARCRDADMRGALGLIPGCMLARHTRPLRRSPVRRRADEHEAGMKIGIALPQAGPDACTDAIVQAPPGGTHRP